MSILERFGSIINANINNIIDRMEDPEKMIDQYLREMTDDLAEVKRSTASVIAEEKRTKREVEENEAEVKKYEELAKKAIQAGNDDDARVFLTKKNEIESIGSGLASSYATAHENAIKMREMHDKLAKDIETLKARRNVIKGKMSVAEAQETMNRTATTSRRSESAMSNFERMEEKADRMLDEANAMSELDQEPVDEATALEEQYANDTSATVEEELSRLKEEMNQN
ncbi:PspA/IM30 family protein [Aerococcaceae bacterium DSM 111020]|nr:PspA/IM30 family protein [Aerococcaceae bacterium DSM 111020]